MLSSSMGMQAMAGAYSRCADWSIAHEVCVVVLEVEDQHELCCYIMT